jgi:RimJ/RimL family protein N-acetyltransferase
MTGQVCVDQFEGEFYGGVSTQAGFIRGAARSPGGKPIICLASTLIRPARASDAGALQAQFHRLTPDEVYTRFFRRARSLSYAELQTLCNVNHETEVAFLAVTAPRESEVVVGSACYFLNSTTNLAEIAFMVAPEWQGQGVGTALQGCLQEYAIGRGVRGFVAEMLPHNARMLRLATHAPGTISTTRDEDSVHVTILFQNKALHEDAVASENFTPSRSLKFQSKAPEGNAEVST